LRFELAVPADDADLRRVLAETPMGGPVALVFRREPSYFEAATVDGRQRQVVVARDTETGRVIGFGSRSVMDRYVNGRAMAIGYLSGLRILTAYRGSMALVGGFRLLRRIHADERTPLYLTTIAEGNELALSALTAGRAGLPAYHFAGRYLTGVLPLARASPRRARRGTRSLACATGLEGLTIRSATPADLAELLAFLNEAGPRRQFFPRCEIGDFFTRDGLFRELRPRDILLAFRGTRLVGTLAAWDQSAFRQNVVHRYSRPLRWIRPLYNAWARLTGRPTLPAPGKPLRVLTAALPLVADDDPDTFAALLASLRTRAAGGPWTHFAVGLHERDPLAAVLRRLSATLYITRLYLVCWLDGEALRKSVDGRPPYLELGSL
jgi:hypothetical protein